MTRTSRLNATSEYLLKAEIRRLLGAAEAVEAETKRLEEEMASLLGAYYDRVGGVIARLRETQARIAALAAIPGEEATLEESDEDALAGDGETPARQLRKLYHDLAKRCHPDIRRGEEHDGGETMKRVNQAYAEKAWSALLRLRFDEECREMRRLSRRARADRLMACRREAEEASRRAAQRQESVRSSGEYALYQRAWIARLRGEDFLGAVAARVETDLAAASRRLEYLTIRAQLMEES